MTPGETATHLASAYAASSQKAHSSIVHLPCSCGGRRLPLRLLLLLLLRGARALLQVSGPTVMNGSLRRGFA